MNQKQRVFIYDRKEMGILTLLGVMVAVFAFTLGVHLGKKITAQNKSAVAAKETAPIATTGDQVPDARELGEQAKGAEAAADESLRETLHEEVEKSGVKTDQVVQVELPRKPKTQNAGATTLQNLKHLSEKVESAKVEKTADEPTQVAAAPSGRFTLQIGSYPSSVEARARVAEIAKNGLSPFFKEADLKGRGRWYRVYLGAYGTKAEAEKAGQKFRAEKVIGTFIVAKVAATD